MQQSAILLPELARTGSTEPWVETHVCEYMCAPVWVKCKMRDPHHAGILCCKVSWPLGNSWHFFICAPDCWFTQLLMANEVRSRRHILARESSQRCPHTSLSLSVSPPPLSLSVYSTLLWLGDIFSASFIYALFHQYGVLLAKCLVKLSLKIRDEFISLSLTCLRGFFCLPSFPISSWNDLCSPCMQRLTNGLEISWLERMESRLAESESMARLKLTLSKITLYTITAFSPCIQWGLWISGRRYVLFIIRRTQQCRMIWNA